MKFLVTLIFKTDFIVKFGLIVILIIIDEKLIILIINIINKIKKYYLLTFNIRKFFFK